VSVHVRFSQKKTCRTSSANLHVVISRTSVSFRFYEYDNGNNARRKIVMWLARSFFRHWKPSEEHNTEMNAVYPCYQRGNQGTVWQLQKKIIGYMLQLICNTADGTVNSNSLWLIRTRPGRPILWRKCVNFYFKRIRVLLYYTLFQISVINYS